MSQAPAATELMVRIDATKPHSKNTLRAFVDFTLLDIGIMLRGATVHEKGGRRWLGMPSRSFSNAEGTQWTPIVEFVSREARDRIADAVLAAYDRFVGGAR